MAIARLRSTDEWIAQFGANGQSTVITIGNFDGVHLGHRAILQRVLAEAHATRKTSSVLTFYPHPAQVLRPAEAPSLLETIDQRLARLEEAGIDAVLVARFTRELSSLQPQAFAEKFLAETMRASVVFVGANFRFGHKQAGDVKMLTELGSRLGFTVQIVPPVLDATGEIISSSAIRASVREGRMEDAARLLGRPFALEGQVRTGTGIGSKLVVPTLNLATEQQTLPKLGVYATETTVAGTSYQSITNVGMRPTFDGSKLAIESHLFGFNENVTSGPLAVQFLTRIRDEKKFSGPEELKLQILHDIEDAKKYFHATKQTPE